ncbi:hypothetical protein ACIRJS_32375 [Streptomyces sp. NPDC102340]|uniref:hypothetical protein n=1 Tax=unclassified Streptomyces TaxID=2593676 RepID=UPI003811178A
MTGQPLTTSTTAPKRRISKALIAIVAGYALTFLLRSDSIFLLGLLGAFVMIGGYVVLALATYPKASGRGASDVNQPDPATAIRAHYAAVLGWCAVQVAVAVVGLAVTAALGTTYLFPLIPLSIVAAIMALGWTSVGAYWTWKCARAVRTFQPVARPFHPLSLRGNGKRSLRLGDIGSGESPIMAGMDPLLHDNWPAGSEDWVWFAGDDAFGGVVMLPRSGMLIFVQPKDWDETEAERKAAGPERTQQAERAGVLKQGKM